MQQQKKQFISKVCYVFLGLTFACVLAFIIWQTHFNQESKDKFVIPSATTQAYLNNTCPVWSLTGDNYCDDQANVPECGYDFKDCCVLENDRSLCEDCYCHVLDFNLTCNVENWAENWYNLGDSICDLHLNNVENLFDLGDCCLEENLQDLDLCRDDSSISWIGCPENPCIKSNVFCIEDQLGDGICQDHNNSPFCEYDLGDCCLSFEDSEEYYKYMENMHNTTRFSECCDCACVQISYIF